MSPLTITDAAIVLAIVGPLAWLVVTEPGRPRGVRKCRSYAALQRFHGVDNGK